MSGAKKLITERQTFIEKVVPFVHELLNAQGTVLKHETHSAHMYAFREFKFEGFTFQDEGSLTMFGGDEVTIFYQGWLVFKVRYHDIKEAEVKEFDHSLPCPDWRTPLKKLMQRGVSRISAKLAAVKKKAETKYQKNVQVDAVQKQLQKEMERLRLVI